MRICKKSKCSICALCLVALVVVFILQLVLRDANKRAGVMLGQERASGVWAANTMTRVGKQIISSKTNLEQRLHATGMPGGREAFAVIAEQCASDIPRLASDKNQIMDALLNQPQIPSDYGETMRGKKGKAKRVRPFYISSTVYA